MSEMLINYIFALNTDLWNALKIVQVEGFDQDSVTIVPNVLKNPTKVCAK